MRSRFSEVGRRCLFSWPAVAMRSALLHWGQRRPLLPPRRLRTCARWHRCTDGTQGSAFTHATAKLITGGGKINPLRSVKVLITGAGRD
jgi:hypothetical protein